MTTARTDSDLPNVLARLLAARSEVRLAILFGSRATGRADANSDIDLAVATEQRLDAEAKIELIETIAGKFGLPVDLVDLRQVGEPLLGRILQHGRRLVDRDSALLAELYKRHLFDSADFLPYRRRMLDVRRKAWIGS